MKKIQHHHVHLNNREVSNFLHNAQLATCEKVSDEVIPALATYTKHLIQAILEKSQFTRVELCCILASGAYTLWETRDEDGSRS